AGQRLREPRAARGHPRGRGGARRLAGDAARPHPEAGRDELPADEGLTRAAAAGGAAARTRQPGRTRGPRAPPGSDPAPPTAVPVLLDNRSHSLYDSGSATSSEYRRVCTSASATGSPIATSGRPWRGGPNLWTACR